MIYSDMKKQNLSHLFQLYIFQGLNKSYCLCRIVSPIQNVALWIAYGGHKQIVLLE